MMLTRLVFFSFLLSLWQCRPNGTPALKSDPGFGGLSLPEGFGALVVTDSSGRGRHLAVRSNGDVYIKLSSSDSEVGGIVALRDTTEDGKADQLIRFGWVDSIRGTYGTTMLIYGGHLYFASALGVYRKQFLNDSELVPSGPTETVLLDDHAHGTHWHITKPMAFDRSGAMYVPFGAPSNSCQDLSKTPNGASGGVGLDPCLELELHGGIWKFPANRLNLRQNDGVKVATGLRSIVGMQISPLDDQLYVVMHGRDNLYSLYPDRYTAWQNALLPAEELIKVKPGAHYGWPYCYYDQMEGKMMLAPEYGGNGQITSARCDTMEVPLMGFPGHWAPNDILFYQGHQFPDRYRQGVFIAFHGSTNRTPYPQAGYFVAFVPFQNNQPTGWEVFADGFAGVDTIVNTRDAKYRPVGLAEGPDGSLYISDSNKGKIWRVFFTGNKANFGEKQLALMEQRKEKTHLKSPDPQKDDLQAHLDGGEKLYNTFCGTCHQMDGQGAAGRFPTLVNTDWVSGNKERLIRLTLFGLQGKIEVNGEVYDGVMPPHNFLNDEELANILTYIRQNFDNHSSPVTPDEIKQLRQITAQ